MDIKELRVGNIVRHNVKDDESETGFCEPNEAEINIHDMNYFLITDYEIKKIEPVKLTDEWLERAGFEMLPEWTDKKKDGAIAYLDLGYLNISKNMLGGITLCDNQGLSTGVHIEYVHQLQNLYFVLTGTELIFKERGEKV
jgi:hypothetical protein